MPINAHPDVTVAGMEKVIRDAAGTVLSGAVNRRDHPSFGNSKASLRIDLAHMEGMIGLYMVLTGQAFHASVPGLATFEDLTTEARVREARLAVAAL